MRDPRSNLTQRACAWIGRTSGYVRFAIVAGPLSLCAVLQGCASGQISTSTLDSGIETASNPPVGAGEDCGRLTGRMQVRILQIRDYQTSQKTSGLSRGLQGFATSLIGGTKQGMDPDQRYRRDVEQLHAQNSQLRALGCPSFDLDKELQAKGFTHTPTPR